MSAGRGGRGGPSEDRDRLAAGPEPWATRTRVHRPMLPTAARPALESSVLAVATRSRCHQVEHGRGWHSLLDDGKREVALAPRQYGQDWEPPLSHSPNESAKIVPNHQDKRVSMVPGDYAPHAVHERVEKRLLRDGDRQDALSVSLIHPVFELLLPFLGQGDPPSPPLIPREDSLQGLRLGGSFDHVVHLDLRRGVRNDRQNVAEVHDADALTHQS